MIRENLNDMTGLSKVVPVMGKGVDDSVEFLVMDIPILFGGMEFVMKEEKRVPSVIVLLFKYAGVGLIGGISGESNRFSGLEGANINVIADI